jgi:hypothetical protein
MALPDDLDADRPAFDRQHRHGYGRRSEDRGRAIEDRIPSTTEATGGGTRRAEADQRVGQWGDRAEPVLRLLALQQAQAVIVKRVAARRRVVRGRARCRSEGLRPFRRDLACLPRNRRLEFMSLQRRIGRTLIIDNDRCRFSPRIRALKERTQRKRLDHAVDRGAPEGASQSGRFAAAPQH